MGNKCQTSEQSKKARNTFILDQLTDIDQEEISQITLPTPIKTKFLHEEETNNQRTMPSINILKATESPQMQNTQKYSIQKYNIGCLSIPQQTIKGTIQQNLNQKTTVQQSNVRKAYLSISNVKTAETKSENVIKLSNLLAKKQKFYPLVSIFQGN